MAKLTVLLPTYNEAANLASCLETIKWVDEILVVDSYSTDETLIIAKKYSARIIQHEYVNSAKQKNWAIPQCTNEWVLQLDADERLEPSLVDEIRKLLQDPPVGTDGYRINFKHYLLGKWLRYSGVYPEYHLRLFRKDVGRFQDREVDAHVIIPDKVGTLKNHILHFGAENLGHRLRSLDRYTMYESDERERQGRKYSLFALIFRPLAAFIYYLIYKKGYRDGIRGLILAFLKMDFIFWTYAKLWEKEVLAEKR
jgi:glycosyltransferase involved in cell wall biosynthesis